MADASQQVTEWGPYAVPPGRHVAARRPGGAALDVWYRYPREPGKAAPAARPFHELPNVLMTSHVSD